MRADVSHHTHARRAGMAYASATLMYAMNDPKALQLNGDRRCALGRALDEIRGDH
jgi:hypothetical protein